MPELIAQQIDHLVPQDGVVEITKPLRIDLAISRQELLEATIGLGQFPDVATVANSAVGRRLAAAVEQVIRPHLAHSQQTSVETAIDKSDQVNNTSTTNTARSSNRLGGERESINQAVARQLELAAPASRLLRLLCQWRRDGELGLYLKSFSLRTLALWHAALFSRLGGSSGRETPPLQGPSRAKAGDSASVVDVNCQNDRDETEADDATIVELAAQTVRRLRNATADHPTRLTSRILVAVELAYQLGLRPDDERMGSAVDDVLPVLDRRHSQNSSIRVSDWQEPRPPGLNTDAKTSSRRWAEADLAQQAVEGVGSDANLHRGTFPDANTQSPSQVHNVAGGESPERPKSHSHVTFKMVRGGDVHLASALPFLLLGPLSGIGYLQTIDAALAAANRLEDISLFAAMLATKVLAPPSPGGQQTPEAIATAAAFAGLETLPPLKGLADVAGEFVSPPNSVLARAVMRGRNPQRPLLLTAVETNHDGGLLLTDIDGLFFAAWAADLDGLTDTLQEAETALLLIDARSASTALLAELDQRGFRFITDAPPARGERWRMVQGGPGRRWITNDRQGRESALRRSALELAAATELVNRIWSELAVVRPTANENDLTLDHAVTLAAALALGQIAWTLWHEREPTDPLLTLERFGDLDTRVRFDDETVHVMLPLGRRSLDLAGHGLLADVHDVPWFGGRVVTFTKG